MTDAELLDLARTTYGRITHLEAYETNQRIALIFSALRHVRRETLKPLAEA